MILSDLCSITYGIIPLFLVVHDDASYNNILRQIIECSRLERSEQCVRYLQHIMQHDVIMIKMS